MTTAPATHLQPRLCDEAPPLDPLARFSVSPRERQVLKGLAQGKTNSQIGRSLFLAEDTIKTHLRRLFRKLDVTDRTQAITFVVGIYQQMLREILDPKSDLTDSRRLALIRRLEQGLAEDIGRPAPVIFPG